MFWQPFKPKEYMRYGLPDDEHERQQRANNDCSCIKGNQGIAWIHEVITEQLTHFLGKNTIYNLKNTDSRIIDIANCKTCKKSLLAAQYLILIIYYYQTAKRRALYESSGGPTDNLTKSDMLGDYH
jgi:hypothetical protein